MSLSSIQTNPLNFSELYQQFITGLQTTSPIEFVAVISGIASVWFSRKESILTYPVGLINTIFYVYLSIINHLPGESAVNIYYTVMSVYGWYNWARKDQQQHTIVHITRSSQKEWLGHIAFFLFFYVGIYFALVYLKHIFFEGAIPWADAFASATAFTGMWLMTKKKVESWHWWILTNVSSIPLYFIKGLVLTSVYYFILLALAFWGLAEWNKRSKQISI